MEKTTVLIALLAAFLLCASNVDAEDYLANPTTAIAVHERHPSKNIFRRGTSVPQRYMAGFMFEEFELERMRREYLRKKAEEAAAKKAAPPAPDAGAGETLPGETATSNP